MALVNHAETRGGRELGPVGGSRQPVQVVAQKLVTGRSAVHQRVADHCCSVADRVAYYVLFIYKLLSISLIFYSGCTNRVDFNIRLLIKD